MITFWLYAGLLLVIALAFILVPQLRLPRGQVDVDRTRANVGLYRERLRDLEIQRDAGTLDAIQLEVGRVEAARNLLDDTRISKHAADTPLGRTIPLIAALSTPLLALMLYLHWGSQDQLMLAREHAGHSARSIEEITTHLEVLLGATPDSVEGWSLLGRAYTKQERMADAAYAFERAATLAGRSSELLGDWAQALYFAGKRQWTPQLQALTDEALANDPQEATSLKLVGLARFEAGRYTEAVIYWERLAATLPEGDPRRLTISDEISHARELTKASTTKEMRQ
ncbi:MULTISPECIES: c-type cytochrome biogenesis protein CcmI [Oxalobacteraceae]|uniref:C-type cytochrome biogenesis protein CcmI n=1 Tax=Herminiimonas aquatilis TaxID=345342 RepID=A0ABW2J5A0_9BURK|nr:c-type cytochrome biogenesis protein CcmI [Janthinobacterium sp. Marseille]